MKYLGYGWIFLMIIGYVALRLTSEHGGGLLFDSSWGDIWIIALACLPGVGLLKLSQTRE